MKKIKKILLIVLGMILLISNINCAKKFDVVKKVLESLTKDTSLKFTTIIVTDSKKLSTVSHKIINNVLKIFPTIAITEEIMIPKIGSIMKRKVREKLFLELSGSPENSALKILFIDIYANKRSLISEIIQHFKFLHYYTYRSTRPKCLLFLVTKKSNKKIERKILKFMWILKYLQSKVIKIIVSKKSVKKKIHRRYFDRIVDVSILDFNPFKNRIQIKQNIRNGQLFPDKTQDLNGYPLVFDAFINVPRKISKLKKSTPAYSFLGEYASTNLVKYIIDDLNCSGIIRTIRTINPMSKNLPTLTNDRIDMSTFEHTINPLISKYCYVVPYLLKRYYKLTLCVKQYGYNETLSAVNIILLIVVFIFIIVLFLILKKLFRLRLSNFDILLLLLGSCINSVIKKPVDRVIFLTLICVSIIFTSDLIDKIFSTSFSQRLYYDIKTIDDVSRVPFTYKTTEEQQRLIEVQSYNRFTKEDTNSTIFLDIMKKIDKVHNESDDCFYLLYKTEVNLCETYYPYTLSHKTLYENYAEDGSVLNVIAGDYGIDSYYSALLISQVSPYADKFNSVVYKIMEYGFYQYWNERNHYSLYTEEGTDYNYGTGRVLTSPVYSEQEVKKIMKITIGVSKLYKIPKLDIDQKDFIIRLLLVLTVGYTLSITVFFFK